MSLKDILQEDIHRVFFDVDEFGENHSVNGREMCIIIDDNELEERQQKSGKHFDGLYKAVTLIYVKAAEYGIRPKVGSVVVLDGKKHMVTAVAEEYGVYSITLEANRV